MRRSSALVAIVVGDAVVLQWSGLAGTVSGGFLIGASGYAYPQGEVLWLVFPIPTEQTEIFEQLP